MEEYRIKIISEIDCNISLGQDEKGSRSQDIDIFSIESACDYNIIIVDLRAVDVSKVIFVNKKDFVDFFNKPSIILCISYRECHHASLNVTTYDWLPNKHKFNIKNKSGESLSPTKQSGHFNELFSGYEWKWDCYFENPENKVSYVSLANNISGQSIALMDKVNQGKVIIVPIPKAVIDNSKKGNDEYSNFIRKLIDISKAEIRELTNTQCIEPEWVDKYVMDNDTQLRGKISDLQREYMALQEARKLFYEMSKPLTEIVNYILKEIRFDTKMKEDEGIQDIEICEKDLNFVIEVTSSENDWININKTRQLADWCTRFEKERKIKPKGLLIANSFCNLEPPKRDEPFTIGAINQAKSENYCLMTTLQLYEIYNRYINGKMDKESIKTLLLKTKGLLLL